ncbi:MAG: GGDEF domain-containing protein [Rhodocyclaceae bacterium]
MQNGLQFENYSLRQQLEALLSEARRNEDKMRRFDQLERSLIGARSLTELLHVLLVDYQAAFDIEFVSLALLDEEYEAARILEASTGSAAVPGLLLLQSDDLLTPLCANGQATCLCVFDARRHGPLFDAPAGAIVSVALLPLVRQGKLIGSLQLGSAVAERYDAAAGTDFLDRLAAIVAFCLESALTQERLKRVGLTDSLTGVQNRRYFEHRCLVEISQAQRHRQPLACMFLDIDKFKRINDSHGHQSGDVVLRGVAEVIQAQLRASDTIARYGGEEFVVLLPQTAALHAQEIAERIRVAVAAQAFRSQSDQTVPVTISIGLAMLPLDAAASEPAAQAEMLIATADRALYQAKHGGRNRVVSDFVCPVRSERETWQGRAAQWLSSVQRQFRGAFAQTAR